jgi:predicted TIM-barrel fold metal-dependent hydrolase
MKRIAILTLTALLLAACSYDSGVEESAPALAATPVFEEILKIDIHSHIFEDIPEFAAMMERINLRIVNICVRGNVLEGVKRQEEQAEAMFAKYPRQFLFASTFDLSQRNDPDYADKVNQWLDQTYEAGAVMTKIWKEVGMEMKTPDGAYLMPDDPIFDPIYAHMASRSKPLIAHLAEPLEAWLPLDRENVHYGYYSENPEWHLYGKEGYPSHAEIIAARDHILEKHPDLVVIGAHFGSLSHDVDEIARRLDKYPNFYVEAAARTNDFTRQPSDKVRDFMIKYQDRVLYGVDLVRMVERDGPMPQERRAYYVSGVEDRYRMEYEYYAGSGAVEMKAKIVEALALPPEVLEKFYHGNAQRVIPELDF